MYWCYAIKRQYRGASPPPTASRTWTLFGGQQGTPASSIWTHSRDKYQMRIGVNSSRNRAVKAGPPLPPPHTLLSNQLEVPARQVDVTDLHIVRYCYRFLASSLLLGIVLHCIPTSNPRIMKWPTRIVGDILQFALTCEPSMIERYFRCQVWNENDPFLLMLSLADAPGAASAGCYTTTDTFLLI